MFVTFCSDLFCLFIVVLLLRGAVLIELIVFELVGCVLLMCLVFVIDMIGLYCGTAFDYLFFVCFVGGFWFNVVFICVGLFIWLFCFVAVLFGLVFVVVFSLLLCVWFGLVLCCLALVLFGSCLGLDGCLYLSWFDGLCCCLCWLWFEKLYYWFFELVCVICLG